MAAALAGATLFFGFATPVLLPQLQLDLSRDELVAEHEAQVHRMTRLPLRQRGDAGPGAERGRALQSAQRNGESDDG